MKRKIIQFIIIFTGICLIAYPWISNYIYEHAAQSTISTYDEKIKETSKDDLKKMLEEARAYNEKLRKAKVVLTDPFSGDATEGISEEEYYHALAVDNTGVMCTLEIPVIGVDLPVYHGTSDEVLEKGIGHLEGTSLPVGGKGTHAVITGHTGINKAKMFTDLTELKKGNQFYIHVLGKVLAYEVDDINVVLPEDTRKLSIVDGKDYVTLITCTPYGENTHRLLVRGKRTKYVPQKRENEKKKKKIGNSQWMRNYRKGIIIGLIVSGIFLLLFKIFQKIRSKKKKQGVILMKRVGKILAFGMIFFGLALFLYPTIQTQEINIKSSPYIKEVDKSYKKNKKSGTRPETDLFYRQMKAYNKRIYKDGQKGIVDIFSYTEFLLLI